jgi:two-component system, response regulator PdtaR
MSSNPAEPPVILVVEDEPVLRILVGDILEDEGFVVAEAPNAEKAMEVLENRSDIRLLFTDINMPGAIDGVELARQVHERWPHIRLVITSGRKMLAHEEIPDDGRFLPKPYRPAELVGKVKELLRVA